MTLKTVWGRCHTESKRSKEAEWPSVFSLAAEKVLKSQVRDRKNSYQRGLNRRMKTWGLKPREGCQTVKYVDHCGVVCSPCVIGHCKTGENPARITQSMWKIVLCLHVLFHFSLQITVSFLSFLSFSFLTEGDYSLCVLMLLRCLCGKHSAIQSASF